MPFGGPSQNEEDFKNYSLPLLTGEGAGGGPNSLKFKTTPIAKTLRKRSTDTENILWRHLRRKQLAGIKFRRQQPIDDYVVDFVSFEKRIIIELDGGQHSLETDKDAERQNYLVKNGFKVLRFWDSEVLQNVDGVLEVI